MALAETRARATSQHVFEHIYSAMRRGTERQELAEIANRLNHTTEATEVRLIRGSQVAEVYGDTPNSESLRTTDPEVQQAFRSREPVLHSANDTLRFLYPVVLEQECLSCHVGEPGKTVNGIVEVTFPLAGLRAPLDFLTDTAFLGFLAALLLIFSALFIVVRLVVVQPIHALSHRIARLSASEAAEGKLDHRPMQARELDDLTEAFNTLMHRVARHRAALEEHARALATAKETAEEARMRADAANTAKSEFLISMSHELRTPLNAILGFSEVIRDEMFGPLHEPRYQTYAGHIHDSGRHLRDLVNDLLDLARIEAGRLVLKPETLDAAAEVSRCVDLFQHRAAESQLTLTQDIAPSLPPLVADRRAVRQVLYNLISNAIKYTPNGGTVTVRARPRQGGIELTVSDTGIGISKEFHELVFSAYGRVSNLETRQIEGTGLGLSLVKALMDLHGGDVTLESQAGTGATFTLHFPLRPPPSAAQESPRPDAPDRPPQRDPEPAPT